MKKKVLAIISLVLAAAFFVTACTTAVTEPVQQSEPDAVVEQVVEPETTPEPEIEDENAPVELANPITQYISYEDLLVEMPQISMGDAPEGSTDVVYQSIDDEEGNPAIAEILFTLDDVEYTYRCAACDSSANIRDISGLNYNYDVNETVKSEDLGLVVEYQIQYCTASGIGHTTWFDSDSACQYDLSAKTSQAELESVTEVLAVKDLYTNNVRGTLSEIGDDEVTLSMENGNVVKFPCYIETDAEEGDKVILWYAGTIGQTDILVLAIQVLEEAGEFFGEVISKNENSITVSNGILELEFELGNAVEISGADTVQDGDIVSVYYTGTIGIDAVVSRIDVEFSVSDMPEIDSELIDKTLKGTVTKIRNKKISIVTRKGKKFTFVRTEDTIYSGKYKLEVGATVRVRYDGYASKRPDAKEIKVLSAAPVVPPKPTEDPTPKTRSVEGTIKATNGIWIVLENGKTYTVNGANCKIKNPENCVIGYTAKIKYYKVGDERIAVKATFLPPKN